MITIQCKECGKKFSGKTEYDAEVKWNNHKCPKAKDLQDMPMDILRKLACGEISEEEAFRLTAERKN